MVSSTSDQSAEADVLYLRSRVTSLEILVCELLAKNQRMRFMQQEPRPTSTFTLQLRN